MNIEINIDDEKIRLILENGDELVDGISWEERNNLSQKLLLEIDNLIKRNRLTPSDISEMSVETSISEKFTTVQIAKVVAKTFNFFNKKS